MFLEVKFTQKLNVHPSVKTTGLLDVQFRQTAVQTDAVRTQLVVLSFGNSTASGGGVAAKHAATHFEGGSDELKPYDIGAALKHGDLNEPFKSLKLIAPFVSSPEFLAAMLGYGFGGYVDEHGESHLWADHLHGRVSFETLEMRYRKLLVSGEDLLVSSGGVVDEVLPYGQTLLTTADGRLVVTQDRRPIYWPSDGRVVFRLKGERGIDLRQFEVDDILRYTWRDTQTGNAGASGWLRVKKCFDTFWVEGEVVSGSPEWLKKGMTVGQFGNYTKKYRQGFINLSARDKHIALWDEVNDPILKPSMLKVYLGDLRYVTDPDLPELSGFGLYSQNAFLKGVFVLRNGKKVDKEFERVETEFLILDGKIASKVSKQEFTSLWTQEADAIVSTVSGEGFKSYILQKADKIEISALETLINGLLTVNGLIKAEKIDVDSLVARSVDTRVAKHGVVISRNQCAIEVFNPQGTNIITISDGGEKGEANIYMRSMVSKDEHPAYGSRGAMFVKGNLINQTHYENSGLYAFRMNPDGESGSVYFRFQEDGIKLPPTATVDMPGALCAGKVYGEYGSHLTKWGAVIATIERIAEGKFKLVHNLNHTNYSTQVTPYGLYDGRPMLITTVVEETLTYVEIWVVDRSNERPLNGNFNYALFGNGKKI